MNQSTPETQALEKGKRKRTNTLLKGTVVVIVGALLLARQVGAEFPEWFFTWQMLVIAIGIYSGVSNGFRDSAWIIFLSVGFIFLAKDYVEGFSIYYAWPVLIIIVGLSMILYSGKKNCQF